jgi:spore germination protein GerM
VPIDLGEQPPGLVPTSTSTTLPVPDSKTIDVYFFDPEPDIERLVDRPRPVPQPGSVRSVVDALLAGTTEAEQERQGLRSEIPEGTLLLGEQTVDDVLVLDFSPEFFELEGDAQSRAFAQIVYSVDDLLPGARIEFRVEGEPRGALTDAGEPVSRCVTVDDFATLHPEYDPESPPDTVPPPDDCDIETVEG